MRLIWRDNILPKKANAIFDFTIVRNFDDVIFTFMFVNACYKTTIVVVVLNRTRKASFYLTVHFT